MQIPHYQLTLDVNSQISKDTIIAKQNDNKSRCIDIVLTASGEPVLPGSGSAKLTAFDVQRRTTVVSDCTISDGVITAELTSEVLAKAGKLLCEITVYGTEGEIVTSAKFFVIVDKKLNGSAISVQRGTTKEICVMVYDEDGAVYELQSGDKLILGVKKNLTDTNYLIQKFATSSDKSGDGYTFTLEPEDTASLSGSYLYEVGLQTAAGEYYIVVECSDFTVTSTLTHKE